MTEKKKTLISYLNKKQQWWKELYKGIRVGWCRLGIWKVKGVRRGIEEVPYIMKNRMRYMYF